MTRLWILAVALMLLCLSGGVSIADGIEGTWRTEDGRSLITIAPCGPAWCGTVTWLAQPFDETGQPKRDTENDDPRLRNRLLIGMSILTELRQLETAGVWKGSVYNPEDGNTYSAMVTLHPRGIRVEGCLAVVLCGSQVWTPVTSP